MSDKITTQEKEVLNFYKSAFCVDGEVKVITNLSEFKIIGVIELNDSKRGKFYVGALKKL